METMSQQSLPWKTRISLSVLAAITSAALRRDGTVNRCLLNLIDFKAPTNPIPTKGVKSSDVIVDPSRDLWSRIFVPSQQDNSKTLPIIVYFHGGGFVHFGPNTKAYDGLCRRLSRKVPAVVISVNYRLAPEHRYPAQYDDGFDVLKFIDDEKNRKALPENADMSSCFLAGDSAGGNLAHHVAHRACQTDFQKLKVLGLVGLQPFFGGEEKTESEIKFKGVNRMHGFWRAFLPPAEGFDRDHVVVNVSGPKAVDISGLYFPTTLVVVGGCDVLQDWQRKYYEWLKRSGKEAYLVEYPNMVHGFYGFPEVPESEQVISEIVDFIHKLCFKSVVAA